MAPEQILEEFEDLEKVTSFFTNKFTELQKKYGGKFIVIKDNNILFAEDSFEKVINNINKKGINIKEVVIKFIPAKGEIILY